jgi:flagellar hook-associated protein 3 FlgL
MNLTKSRLGKIQEQIVSGKSINRPSDSPLGTSRLLKLNDQLGNIATYKENIIRSSSYLGNTISIMEKIQNEIEGVMTDLTAVFNASLGENIATYGSKLNATIDTLLNFANSEFGGQYLFGGTDNSQKPFALNTLSNTVEVQSQNLGGERKIRIAKNIDQKVNITGKEIFQSVLTQRGTLDSAQAIGSTFNTSHTIYNADGNEYTFSVQYEKTAANTYEMTYTIDDGTGPVALAQTNEVIFNSSNGELISVDGNNPSDIQINIGTEKIDFIIDTKDLTEGATNSISSELSQKANIFNTLLSIKEGLLNGQVPNSEQIAIIHEFNQTLLNKLSLAGEVSNRLNDTVQLLENQELEIKNLQSEESDVDIMKAMIDLETQQFNLNLGYKISSMILPKSLMDFL